MTLNSSNKFFEENEGRFVKVYSNIPINLRREIILVIDDNPITWNVAYVEIKNKTELGENIKKINRIRIYIVMVDEEIKELVITRLKTMPANIKMSVGSYGIFSKNELIESVKKENEVGKLVIEMQLKYLKSFKKGII